MTTKGGMERTNATAQEVRVDRDDGIVTVTLDRPEKVNALGPPAWRDLLGILREIAESPDDRCVILTGAEGNFSSGGDIAGRAEQHILLLMQTVKHVVSTLHQLPMPTIAKVRGVAAGAGMNLALACDLVVAGEGARFSEVFIKRGLSVDGGGSWILPRLVGLHRAKELVLLGGWITAEQAASMGVVNRVVPDHELDAFVHGWASELASGPPLAMNLDKSLLNNSAGITLEQALEDEARAQAINFGTKDVREAYKAYMEKRPPVFEGR